MSTSRHPILDQPLDEAAFSDSPQARLHDALLPLRLAAENSTSLIGSEHSLGTEDSTELSRFLLLGPRGGDQAIRIGLFAGFDAKELRSVPLLVDVLLQLKEQRVLTSDFALLAYPVVNPRGFTDDLLPLSKFEALFARETVDPVVRFHLDEFRRWAFHGVIHLRAKPGTRSLHASVRSETIATEVVEPALAAAAPAVPIDARPLRVRASDRYARAADFSHGRFGPPADVRPSPFEIELFLPDANATSAPLEDGLFILITEILRNYRAVISHAQNL